MTNPADFVICPICGARRGQLSRHLAAHKITIDEFRVTYPNAPMTSARVKANMGEANKQRWAKAGPKARRRHGHTIRKAVSAPEVKARHSEAMKRAQADPEKRARIIAGVRKALQDPKKVSRRIDGLRKALAKPSVRQRFSAARKRDWQNPAVRAKLVAHTKAIWADRKHKLAEAERILAKPTGGRIAEDDRAARVDELYKQRMKWDQIQTSVEAEFRIHTTVKALQELRKRWMKRQNLTQ